MSALAVAAIGGYQRWISPYKGFRCAHNALHGRGGCSSFGRRAFERYPAMFAWQLLQRRFTECRVAAILIQIADDNSRRKELCGDLAGASCNGVFSAIDIGDCLSGCDLSGLACDIGSCA